MRAEILDGARTAEAIKREVANDVQLLKTRFGIAPCLAVVRVGDDPASAVYVNNKIKTCEALGIVSEHHSHSTSFTSQELLDLVGRLNDRTDVDGILVQLPLPRTIDESIAISSIDPAKDVDGFHPVNIGRMSLGQPALLPCTPAGIIELLLREKIPIKGKRACVVGRSNIVGKPVAQLLLRNDATVTVCHSRTEDLKEVTRQADILIAAIGKPGIIRGEYIKPGATVIDVGMNRVDDELIIEELFRENASKRREALTKRGFTLVGDVHPAEAEAVAGHLTPVPGGVGLLTVAMLMRNTVDAAVRRRGLEIP